MPVIWKLLGVLLCFIFALCWGQTINNDKSDTKKLRVSRPKSPVVIDLVYPLEQVSGKRGTYNDTDKIWEAVYNDTDKKWHNDIVFTIDPAFKGDQVAFGQVLNYISSRLCVTFHNLTGNPNVRTYGWLRNNGYSNNAFLVVSDNGGCNSDYGQGPGYGSRQTSPCNGFWINLHEMLHVMGVVHSHQERIRDNYMTVHTDDIKPELKFSYSKISVPKLVNDYFDGTSVMIYGDSTWNSDGMETFTPIRDDIFHTVLKFSEENVVFHELSQIYKCNERFCNNDTTDCSPGYHTLYHGRCQCVCPEHLDPETNCKSQINGPAHNLRWPRTPMVFYGGDHCPSEFDPVPGLLPMTLNYGPRQDPVPEKFPVNGSTITFKLCSKSIPHNPLDIDWTSWPIGGQLCFVRPVGVKCGGIFEEGSIEFRIHSEPHPTGYIGDIHINGTLVTINFCCKENENYGVTIDLPNVKPFRLIQKSYDGCPTVRGMKVTRSMFTIWSANSHKFGLSPPLSYFYSNSFLHYQCYYQPPTYGCNKWITLNLTNRTVTLTTPGYPAHRDPNRRCLYDFNVPKDVKLRLTINSFDLQTNDMFLVKRYHQWQDPYQIPNTNWPRQLVSEKNYLSLEFWSSWETTGNKGVNFTVELLPDSEMCYNVSMQGRDYSGNKSVGETYDDCVPWTDAVTCEGFPADGLDSISLLLSGNKCRNPAGALLQPWCYTYVRDRMCHQRYCDVCNLYVPQDVIKNCNTLKASNADFCKSGIERFGCSKTCNLSSEAYNRAQCTPPSLPNDTMVTEGLRHVYHEGETINITCKSSGSFIHQLRCTENGWSGLPFGCNGCPAGWTEYGNRCYRYSTVWVKRREAERVCRSYDATGTLFEIRSLEDQKMVRYMKGNSSYDYHHGNWISGELQSQYGEWRFDTGDPMVYFNWSTAAETTSMSYNCIKLIAEYQQYNDQGGWTSMNCDDNGTAPYMCQVDNVKADTCNDRIRTCSDVMTKLPNFCLHHSFMHAARAYCKRSCGFCQGESQAQCTDPSNNGTHYKRISSSSTVKVGREMIFACNNNLYHTGGDLTRACSNGGHLLGTEPVCLPRPNPVDLKVDKIRLRKSTLAKSLAILLDHNDYRIPFNGKISIWYYYCTTAVNINFFIMRKANHTYQYVGSNSMMCQPNWVMSYRVPAAKQITVLKNDVFGAFTINATALSITDCDTASVKMLQLPAMNITTGLQDLKSTSHQLFAGQKCAVPSLGLRVEPA